MQAGASAASSGLSFSSRCLTLKASSARHGRLVFSGRLSGPSFRSIDALKPASGRLPDQRALPHSGPDVLQGALSPDASVSYSKPPALTTRLQRDRHVYGGYMGLPADLSANLGTIEHSHEVSSTSFQGSSHLVLHTLYTTARTRCLDVSAAILRNDSYRLLLFSPAS